MIHSCTGQVCKQHTECDGEQQERLVLLLNGQVEQEETDDKHQSLLPGYVHEAHLLKEFQNITHFLVLFSLEMLLSQNHEQIILHYGLTGGYGNLCNLAVAVGHNGVLHFHALKGEQSVALLYVLAF